MSETSGEPTEKRRDRDLDGGAHSNRDADCNQGSKERMEIVENNSSQEYARDTV